MADSKLILCRCCNERFSADELAGSYLDRKCPLCGSPLSEADYDSVAAVLCARRKKLTDEEGCLKESAESARRRVDGIRWWQWLFRKKWQREADEAEARLKECRRSLQKTCEGLKPLPTSRYYVSEWYQCTHISLRNDESAEEPRYRLKAYYTPGGLFRLRGKNVESSGYEGEHDAFEQLRKRVVNPESPLFGARLLPNLYLPRDGSEEDMKAGRWRQVDCAVATDKGLFVIEVKRWGVRVSASSEYRMLFVERRGENNGMFAPADQVLDQLERTAVVLGETSPYPKECVFRAVVFVRPRGFESDAEGFVGQSLVSFADYDRAPFADAVEQKLEELDVVLAADDVVNWADNVLVGYGDLHGEYRSRAERNRTEMRSYSNTHHKSRGGTRSRSARKHQLTKRQHDRKDVKRSRRSRSPSIDDEWGWYLDGGSY